jgi:tetrathionate reductase subunit C
MIELLYDVHHQVTFRWLIAIYFYFTGMSAGSFVISTLAYGFGMEKFKPAGKVGVVMATVLLFLAPIMLLLQVGWPIRSIWNHFTYLNFHSPMTYGAFLLTAYPINCIIYGYFMFKGDKKRTKLFGMIGIPLAITVHGYTGFILAFGKARAFWNTALMPFLFLVSAVVSGLGLMILVLMIKDKFFSKERKVNTEIIFLLAKMLGWLIVFDLVLVFCDISVLSISHGEAKEMAQLLFFGQLSPLFLGIENLCGKVIPMIIVLTPKYRTIPAIAVAAALVVFGILFMRFVVVYGGQVLPLV